MMRTFLITAVSAVGLSTAAWAQDAGQTAADVREQPVTQSLNATEASSARTEVATTTAQQDQYELDRAAFRAEVVARREKIEMDQAVYAKQQNAYADAMIAWRIQNDECKRGILKTCKKPTPVPADFYRP
jgi:opacity protein-like surface antigen